ncbi:hypothetical protein LshimejAT787_2300390 [Lyophyllum shimeji]|uniref:RlpA-like double-psi beta-barrel-protein domain-containing protein-containing protein n=1 Tax=Lyophyllum shimeji TaxID=47721 RepID=A0A9P3Q1R5_LYOSH|nr:hypothetical protein LshimejAT787_2300390 [Lyophyllum shimeji]
MPLLIPPRKSLLLFPHADPSPYASPLHYPPPAYDRVFPTYDIMYRVALLALMLFASFFITIASPLPSRDTDATVVDLEKRVTHVGRGTWFHVGQGNCGQWNKDSDAIVAISKKRYDASGGANCDQWVEIVNTKNGKKAYGKTRDSCESCGTEDLDMSPSLFQKLDSLSTGQIKISWHFMAKGWSP